MGFLGGYFFVPQTGRGELVMHEWVSLHGSKWPSHWLRSAMEAR